MQIIEMNNEKKNDDFNFHFIFIPFRKCKLQFDIMMSDSISLKAEQKTYNVQSLMNGSKCF